MPIAVDTSFLLALAQGDEREKELNRRLQNTGFDLFCSNTPLVELAHLHQTCPSLRDAAGKVFACRVSHWRIRDAILEGVPNGIAENVAGEICRSFPNLEYHSALVIAEAACADGIDVLLTWDPDLLRLDHGALALLLKQRDLHQLLIMSPARFLELHLKYGRK